VHSYLNLKTPWISSIECICVFLLWIWVWKSNITWNNIRDCGPSTVVGIATGYGLDGPGIESRWGARFYAPVQTGPGVHPTSCTMGTGSFPGLKSGLGVTLIPHPLLVPWSRKGRAIHTSTPPMGRTTCTEPQCLYKGELYLLNKMALPS